MRRVHLPTAVATALALSATVLVLGALSLLEYEQALALAPPRATPARSSARRASARAAPAKPAVISADYRITDPMALRTIAAARKTTVSWRRLQAGLEYAVVKLTPGSTTGDNRVHLVRVDPRVAKLVVGLSSKHDRRRRTAKRWCKKERLAVAINLGMYHTDYVSHVGRLRVGRHLNRARWRGDYSSVLAFGPRRNGLPSAKLVDIESPRRRAGRRGHQLSRYRVVVQNLRLIKQQGGRGVNVWRNKALSWSEAALAGDGQGRLLFVFVRSPFRMIVLNHILLALPLDIRRAQHLEGGPEASLSIHAGGVNLDLMGSFETRFAEHDRNRYQYKLPNVLGVRRVARARRPRSKRRRRRRPRRRRPRPRPRPHPR